MSAKLTIEAEGMLFKAESSINDATMKELIVLISGFKKTMIETFKEHHSPELARALWNSAALQDLPSHIEIIEPKEKKQ